MAYETQKASTQAAAAPASESQTSKGSALRGMTYDQQMAAVQMKPDAAKPGGEKKIPLIAMGNTSKSDLTATTAATFGAKTGGLYELEISVFDLFRIGVARSFNSTPMSLKKDLGKSADMIAGPQGTITGADTTGFVLKGGATFGSPKIKLSLAGNGLLCVARMARSVFNALSGLGVTSTGKALNYNGKDFELLGVLTMDNPIADTDARNHTSMSGVDLAQIKPLVVSTYRDLAAACMAAWGTIDTGKPGYKMGTGHTQQEGYRALSGNVSGAAKAFEKQLNGIWVEGPGLDPTQRRTYVTKPIKITAAFTEAIAARDAYNTKNPNAKVDTPWEFVIPVIKQLSSSLGGGLDLTFIPDEFADFKKRFADNWRALLASELGAKDAKWDAKNTTKIRDNAEHQASELKKSVTRTASKGGGTAPAQADTANNEGMIAP